MRPRFVKQTQPNYKLGLFWSTALHVVATLFLLLQGMFSSSKPLQEVYSITLEGGSRLGGIERLLEEQNKRPVTTTSQESAPDKVETKPKEPEVKKETVIPVATPTKTQSKKPTPRPTVKPTAKATPKPSKNPKEAPKKDNIDDDWKKALSSYTSQSANSMQGKGIGAAQLGRSPNSIGGGKVMPPEFFIYKKALETRLKSEWRWYDTTFPRMAKVRIKISPVGKIESYVIAESSGSVEFDDSVMRAISKADPVPPPPPSLYDLYFNDLIVVFDPTN